MKYAQVYMCDVANGPGCRTSLFVSGCTHHCKGCFNEVAWDFDFGDVFDENIQKKLIEESKPSFVDGFTFLGGEPMEPTNQKALKPFIEKIKNKLPDKSIWIYSGYTYEELIDVDNHRCHCDETDYILKNADVLVDGEFELQKKDITLRFRGSSNQRIIDLKETAKRGEIVLSPYM